MGFAVSGQGATIAATGNGYNYLYGSFDGGTSWQSTLTISPTSRGRTWHFPTRTTDLRWPERRTPTRGRRSIAPTTPGVPGTIETRIADSRERSRGRSG